MIEIMIIRKIHRLSHYVHNKVKYYSEFSGFLDVVGKYFDYLRAIINRV